MYDGKHTRLTFSPKKVIHRGTQEATRPTSQEFWKEITTSSDESSASNQQEDHEDAAGAFDQSSPVETPYSLFSCPVDGCIKEYQRQANLEKHITLGYHQYAPMQVTLHDAVIKSYSQNLEQRMLSPRLMGLQDAVSPSVFDSLEEIRDMIPMGWTLRQRKPSKSFSLKQTTFLVNIFNQGISENKKKDPNVVAKLMRQSRVPIFAKEEYLNQQQIMSFFSREAARRRKSAAAGQNVPPPAAETIDTDLYTEDPIHGSQDDLVREHFSDGCIQE